MIVKKHVAGWRGGGQAPRACGCLQDGRARQTEDEFEAEGGTRAVGSPGQGSAFGFEPGGSGVSRGWHSRSHCHREQPSDLAG